MPFARPSLSDLITRIGGDLRGRLEVSGPLLRRAMADVISAVWAGAVHSLYGYLDWAVRQLFAATAEREQLLRSAAPYGIVPLPATFATGTVTATGTNGSSILAGVIIKLDAVTSYRVVTGQTIAAGTATLPVIAVTAGAAGNLAAGAAVTFESTVAGVASSAVVATGGITGGDDGDAGDAGTERIRTRYELRLQEPPAGGADQDYKAWALLVAGVTRVWVYRRELGLGTVVVRFVRDNDIGSILPDSGEVAAVQASEDANRPITAAVTVVAPTTLAVAFTIHVAPDNADTRAAIAAELADLLSRVAEPGDGAGRGAVLLSQIRTAVGDAAGVTDNAVTVPAADVVPALGQLATVGTITWV
ncbi:MAG: baseplate J/gp47 family protein [Actinomycetota bacterium]